MIAIEALELGAVFGELAIAAIMAQPIGPARDLEAERWARAAVFVDVEHVVVIARPDEDFIDAHARLMVAIARLRGEA